MDYVIRKSYSVKVSDKDVKVTSIYTDERCIEKVYKKISSEDIYEMIKKKHDINLNNCYIENFNYRELTRKYSEKIILLNFSAQNAFFDGFADFSGAQFSGDLISFKKAQFSDNDTDFSHAQFYTDILDCTETEFGNGFISFKETIFKETKVIFAASKFGQGEVLFNKSHFHKCLTTFKHAIFDSKKLTFQNAIISGKHISFDFARFINKQSLIEFDNTLLNNCKISFWNSEAKNSTLLIKNCNLTENNNLQLIEIDKIIILNSIISGILSFNSTKSFNTTINKLSLENTKNLGAICIDWETLEYAIDKFDSPNNYKTKADQMRMLKENFHNIGEYINEDKAFIQSMRYERKFGAIGKRCILWLLDTIGEYGTNPTRIAIVILATIVFFGILFSPIIPLTEIEVCQNYNDWFKSLYFSIVTFLTIGYSDLCAKNEATAIIASVEGFLGYFLISYFIIATIRKTLR